MTSPTRPWLVIKLGGTSVATAANWANIVSFVQAALQRHRVLIVSSALSQISNRLEQAIDAALEGDALQLCDQIEASHQSLAQDAGLAAQAVAPIHELLAELRRLLEGIALTREASPRLRARILSFGELAATHLVLEILRKHGLESLRIDARELLLSESPKGEADESRFLGATVPPREDVAGFEAAAGDASLVVTQGFIARTPRGETCLLGRGGSDTSASLFGALIGAQRIEIWTDVHGLFTTDPRQIPSARLIRSISYREAQELAAMGAKVLHPGCLMPAAWAGIPVGIRNASAPELEGTRIGPPESEEPAVMAVVRRAGVTLLTLSTLRMWGTSGFLARAFAPFEALGISVDLVATSQSAVSVTLDHIPGGVEGDHFAALLEQLQQLGEVSVVHPCAVVSIVGRRIRTVLHELGPALSVFQERQVHLVSESSEDLNLSFVVDEGDAASLVADLHARLVPLQGSDGLFGPSANLLAGAEDRTKAGSGSGEPSLAWWRQRQVALLEISADGQAHYVYDLSVVNRQARALRTHLDQVSGFYYSMKANPHPRVLESVAAQGFGIECVSLAEVRRAREVLGTDTALLFTPNFCPVAEYGEALAMGAEITVDGPEVLRQAPDTFAGAEIGVRVDPGRGLGHHEKVRTAGAHQKFGYPIGAMDTLLEVAASLQVLVVGLHAHVGSGILDAESWARTAATLCSLRERIPGLRWMDLGGGLGVVERSGQQPLDLQRVNRALGALADQLRGVELRMEPGRFLVSEAGVLLLPVTQVRHKGEVRFIGCAAGMNTLLRPALYGAWHGIHNLSRLDVPPEGYWHVVGPICETGDVLGRDRLLPLTQPGDTLLVENCGAYGAVMASAYNLRAPATERCLEDDA